MTDGRSAPSGGRGPALVSKPTAGKRGPYAKTDALRTKILDAAIAVFGRSGYHGGSLQEIADLVGMSQAGLLYHFSSKQALLSAVLERRDAIDVARFASSDDDPCGRLLAVVAAVESNADQQGLVELFCTIAAEATSVDHPAHAYFRHRYESFRSMLRFAFDGLALRAGLTPDSAAIATISLIDGLQLQWLLEPSAVDMPKVLLGYFDAVVVSPAWRRRRSMSMPPAS